MIKYRLEITKGEPIRYISHLDFASLMQRAICRAHLPAAYSEGFNPHMKISFASALSVGVTSDAEYMDLELKKDICQPELFDKLSKALPPGVRLLKARQIDMRAKALMSIVDEASYSIVLPCQDDLNTVTEAINKFNQTKEIVLRRARRNQCKSWSASPSWKPQQPRRKSRALCTARTAFRGKSRNRLRISARFLWIYRHPSS